MTPERDTQELRQAAALAGAQERRNRPLGLLALAAAALLIAAIFAGASLAGVGGARRAFESRDSQASDILRLASQIDETRAAAATGPSTTRYARERNPLGKFSAVSRQVGLEPAPVPTSQPLRRFDADSPLVLRSWSVSLRGVTAEEGLRWIDLAEDAIDGLHITDMQVRTNSNGWNFELTLARWELGQ